MPRTRTRPLMSLMLAALLALPATAETAKEDAGAYLAARIAGSASDYRAAADWFARALITDPANAQLLESALIAQLSLGDFAKAAKFADQLKQTGSASQVANIAILVTQAASGDFAGISSGLSSGLSVGTLPDKLIAAWAELGNGRMTEALNQFDALAKTNGMQAFGLYHKALALAAAGDFEGADDILSGREAGTLQVMRRGVIAHAQILSQLERNTDAVALLDQAFGSNGDPGVDSLRARLAAGETLPYDVARTAAEGIAEVFFTIATAMNGDADIGFTLIHARAAAHLRPDHTDAILMVAGLLEVQDQPDLATMVYASIPPSDPSFHVAEIGRAEALFATGKTEAAIEVLQALTRSHAGVMGVHLALGDALRREERYADAAASYSAAIKLVPKPDDRHWVLFYSRAICNERIGKWPEAETDFRFALSLRPDQPQVLNYLGYSFLDRNENLEEALSLIERAVAAEPDAGYIVDSLAWALFRLGRFEEAVAPMERASLLEPVDPIVTDHLGDVYWAVGRKREAAFQWQRAASFSPEEKDLPRILRKIEIGLDAVLAEEGAKPLKPVDAAAAEN